MGNCYICQFNGEEFDGEAIPVYGGGYEGGGHWVGICEKGQEDHYKGNGENCKKFKEIILKCNSCVKKVPISQLNVGFCSDICKEDYLNRVKTCVVDDEKALIEVDEKIAALGPANDKNIGEIASLEATRYALEHYIEEGKDILNNYEVTI